MRGRSVKSRRRKPAAPKRTSGNEAARPRSSSTANQGQEFAQLARERDQALEQLLAASEVLKVISSSPGELEPVFQTMLENATRICEAAFGSMLLREGDGLRRVAIHNAPAGFLEFDSRTPV